jgi:hypothetical protein
MTAEEIRHYLTELNDELRQMDVKGEVSIYGGAVMCLVYESRPATKDVDAVFRPTSEIRRATNLIAERHGLPPDWLNDGVKGYLVDHEQRIFIDLPNLKVFVPEPDYLLAMKTLSARADTFDKADVKLLIEQLALQTPEDVFTIVEKYYPRQQIRPATQYFIEELFGK